MDESTTTSAIAVATLAVSFLRSAWRSGGEKAGEIVVEKLAGKLRQWMPGRRLDELRKSPTDDRAATDLTKEVHALLEKDPSLLKELVELRKQSGGQVSNQRGQGNISIQIQGDGNKVEL
jgi:hypothetical protein